jgi:hypothetical protein
MIKYKNSLIGRHFKILQQLTIFQVHNDPSRPPKDDSEKNFLCDTNHFILWKAIGEFGALVWFPEIRDMKQYCVSFISISINIAHIVQSDLQICINNVLDAYAVCNPERIIQKLKLHIITHLPADIANFGPAILYATEGFESFNSVFRKCSILSNHQAPSCDIAQTFNGLERFKHQASGGWWKDASGKYVRAGPESRKFFAELSKFRKRLGWTQELHKAEGMFSF